MTIESFQEELTRFDPSLTIRKNFVHDRWEIIGRAGTRGEYLLMAIANEDIGLISNEIIAGIWRSSPTKQGGAEAVNNRLDALRAKEEEDEERRTSEHMVDLAKESYWHKLYLDKCIVSQHIPVGNKGEEIVVNDRRRHLALV